MWLLGLEIGLVIAAWKRGWRWWALMVLGIQFFAIFATRLVMLATVGHELDSFPVGDIADALLVIALAMMTIKGRRVRLANAAYRAE